MGVPDIDVVDSTWICASPATLAALVADPANWRRWWPNLDLAVEEWRGVKGMRWTVRSAGRGRLAGSMEVWLESVHDGVVVHNFLRLDRVDGRPLARGRRDRVTHAHRKRTKQVFWTLGDQLEPGRIARIAASSEG